MDALVKVNGVHKYFTRGSERIDVLKGVNLEIPKGDFLALMGPSGSGKTSLLNLMGGLDQPSAGSIDIGGTNIATLSGGTVATRLEQLRSGLHRGRAIAAVVVVIALALAWAPQLATYLEAVRSLAAPGGSARPLSYDDLL